MHIFLAQLVRNFDFSISNPEEPWRVQTLWFSYQHDLYMQLRARPGRTL